jgi:hypothetical protein
VWEGFALHPGIPLGVLAVIMALCGGFLKLMEKFAKTVLFGTFLAEAAFCLYLAFAGKWELGRAIVFSAFALAIGIYVVVMRRKIIKAGDCISVASNALLSMPSLMATVYGWMLASVALVVVLIAVAIASGNHSVVNQGSETGLSSNPYNMTSGFEKYKYPCFRLGIIATFLETRGATLCVGSCRAFPFSGCCLGWCVCCSSRCRPPVAPWHAQRSPRGPTGRGTRACLPATQS